MITLLHNPHCSKSRAALTMAQQFAADNGLALSVVDYQATPLLPAQLQTLQQQLGLPLRDMLRSGEALFDTLQLAQADDQTLLAALAAHPQLLQRPIAIYQGRAMIGRPPEQLQTLLRTA